MIQRSFEDIKKKDIDCLINDKISESKTLEYKQMLPGSTDKAKKEFLADVSSFANSSGGDIIYGVKGAADKNGKKTGEPEKVIPLHGMTADEAKLRMENLIRNGIDPRIIVHIKEITGYGNDGAGYILIVRIPQSFASPHMVKDSSRFYCRNSAGKYPLDVHEMRNAFLATDSQVERVRSFLQNRLAKIIADETPLKLSNPCRLVLHVIPISNFLNKKRLDLSSDNQLTFNFKPMGVSAWDNRYNLEGYLTYRINQETKFSDSYCQLFFNGTVEAVAANILKTNCGKKPQEGETAFIGSIAYERRVVDAIKRYLNAYKVLGVEAPIFVSMALLGCKGAYLTLEDTYPIDRDVIILPDVQFENYDEEVPVVVKPIFDAVWNACGLSRSFNYTQDGVWNVREL